MNWRKVMKIAGISLIVLWVIPIVLLSIPQTAITYVVTESGLASSIKRVDVAYTPLIDEVIPGLAGALPDSLLVIVPYLAILTGAILLTRLEAKKHIKEENNA